MKVLVLTQNYVPEEQNAYHHEMTRGLLARGHDVTVLTAFPHYGSARVYEGYRGKVFQRETIDGVKVIRTWVYASDNKRVLPRLLTYISFCLSSLIFGAIAVDRPEVMYTSIPPLPLGVVGILLARLKRAKLVISIQDIFPEAAVQLGVIKNRSLIAFFESLEKFIYRQAQHIVVISEGFRLNLLTKGVSGNKVSVVSNWADPTFVKTGPKSNSMRIKLNVGSAFTLIYSGGLTHNSHLEPIIGAADILREEPFEFVVIGEGVKKARLQQMASAKSLTNLHFFPFVPLSQYPEVLLAADINLVTLDSRATTVSVPSKIFKQMAAGRPVIAITSVDSELARLIKGGRFGFIVPPNDPVALVEVLRFAADNPEELKQLGLNARRYLVENHSLDRCIDDLSTIIDRIEVA